MIDFNKFAQEGNAFINRLSRELDHEDDKGSVSIALRSVLHTLRDRISIQESFHLLSQLPFFLKAVYAEGWKYRDKPLRLDTIDDFKEEVKMRQQQYGEREFDWATPTEDIIKGVIHCLKSYVNEQEWEHVQDNLPPELKSLVDV